MSKQTKGSLILLLTAMIWGFAFVAQDLSSEYTNAFNINMMRNFIAVIALLPLVIYTSKKENTKILEEGNKRKQLLIAGMLCGACLCVASTFQQLGIGLYPSNAAASGRSGFITAMYVVLVPILGLFLHKKVSTLQWVSVLLSIVGMYLLCFSSGVSGLYLGDIIVFICAICFCVHILCIDHFISAVNGVKMAWLQFLTACILSFLITLFTGGIDFKGIQSAIVPLLYLGVMSSGIAYTLQIIGQKYQDNPTIASIIMCLESVFALIGGMLFGEVLSIRELVGCGIMFIAVILSQLPTKKD